MLETGIEAGWNDNLRDSYTMDYRDSRVIWLLGALGYRKSIIGVARSRKFPVEQ